MAKILSGRRVGGAFEPYYLSASQGRMPEGVTVKNAITDETSRVSYSEAQGGQGSVIIVQPVLPATGEEEKIIRSAEVRLEVEDGKVTYNKLSGICKEFNGYLGSSKFYKDKEGRESGMIPSAARLRAHESRRQGGAQTPSPHKFAATSPSST